MDKMDEKTGYYVTRTAEEDLLVVATAPNSPEMTTLRWLAVILLSISVIGVYFTLNRILYPSYPVVNAYAESNKTYDANYPPFRLNEFGFYELTESLLSGDRPSPPELKDNPLGYSLLAAPLTMKFGEIGMYYTNAVIMWASMLVFFLLMVQLTRFRVAVAFTAVLAFASPNLFFAASAYGDSLSQLLLLLSVLFLARGLSSYKEPLHYALCGFTIGLQVFAQPYLVFTAFVFVGVIFAERSFKTWKNSGILSLVGGIAAALLLFLIVHRIAMGRFPGGFFSGAWLSPGRMSILPAASECSPVLALWKYLFDSPQGLLFIMPVAMLAPLGIILMWRDMYRSHAIVAGTLFLYVILMASVFCGNNAGESLGGRLLLPVIPLVVMPLAFVWEQEVGEKIWLVVTLVFTISISSFGWWVDALSESEMFGNIVQDRDARTIMLARDGLITQPIFKTRSELLDQFTKSLRERNMWKWFETLNPMTIATIHGVERIVFSAISGHVINGDVAPEEYIDSVDPDSGIMLVLPEISEWGDSRFLPIRSE